MEDDNTINLEKEEAEINALNNKVNFLAVVGIVSCLMLIAVVLGSMILYSDKSKKIFEIPELIAAIGSSVLGALIVFCFIAVKNKNC